MSCGVVDELQKMIEGAEIVSPRKTTAAGPQPIKRASKTDILSILAVYQQHTFYNTILIQQRPIIIDNYLLDSARGGCERARL